MAENVLDSYLVGLGFKVDQSGADRAVKTVDRLETGIEQLNETMTLMAKVLVDVLESLTHASGAADRYRSSVDAIANRGRATITAMRAQQEAAKKAGDAIEDASKQTIGGADASDRLTLKNFGLAQSFNVARSGALAFIAGIAGIGAATAKTASSYSQMFYQAKNAGASVSGMNAFAYGIKQMGGTAEGAISSLAGLGNFLKFNGPGAASMLNGLGISTTNANGSQRDTASILTDFMSRAHDMPAYRANAYAQEMGIDQGTLQAGMRDPGALARYESQQREIYRRIGVDQNRSAENSAQFMRKVNEANENFKALKTSIMDGLEDAFSPEIDDFNNYIRLHPREVHDAIQKYISDVKEFFSGCRKAWHELDHAVTSTIGWKTALEGLALYMGSAWLARMLAPITAVGVALARVTAPVAVAAGRAAASGGAAAASSFGAAAEETGAAALAGGGLRVAKRLAPWWAAWALLDPTDANSNESGIMDRLRAQGRLSAIPTGIQNNNPGNLLYVGQAGATQGVGKFAAYATAGDGLTAMAQQLRLYMRRDHRDTVSSIISKWAPASDNNNTASYISQVAAMMGVSAGQHLDPDNVTQLAALMHAITTRENAYDPFSDVNARYAAAAIGKRGGVTVSQTINNNITGVRDPEQTGQSVSKAHNLANAQLVAAMREKLQ